MRLTFSRKFRVAVLGAALLGAALWTALGQAQTTNPPLHLASTDSALQTLNDLSEAFVAVASKVRPAVVKIEVQEAIKMPSRRRGTQLPPGLENSPFRQFFQFPEDDESGDESEFQRQGVGSGVIVDSENGYVLTNAHVVAEAKEIEVTLDDKRIFAAKLVGADPASDIAVIKIEGKNLPSAALGQSRGLRVGEMVLAIGSPFQLGGSVTQGIISATGRDLGGGLDKKIAFQDFIQTDASINLGNSGGPLVNLQGEIVGINTAIATPSMGSAGVGFAVPIDLAHDVMSQLIASGKVTRGYLGVSIQAVEPAMARRYGLDRPSGALVAELVAGGPGEKAGLEEDDMITEVDGEKVDSVRSFLMRVGSMKPGQKVTLKVLREGQEKEVQATLGERPSEDQIDKMSGGEKPAAPESPEASGTAKIDSIGLEVQDITPELARRLNLKNDKGVIVSDVKSGSPAQRVGIQEQTVVTAVGGHPVNSAAEFEAAVKKDIEANSSAMLRVRTRDGRSLLVAVEPRPAK